jgi:bifunctional non-homologous end joining protein LigD
MRDFGVTPEPSGGKPKKTKLPIFVIQKHQASHLHYDFRLEMEGVLKSWAVPKGPSYDPSTKRLAMMTEDHPYDYAKFEGVIPAGNYGAGNVIIWDEGTWEFIEPGDDPVAAINTGKLTFRMFGKKMFGEWALVKIGGRGKSRSDKGNEWLLLKHRDPFANDKIDITEFAPRSVVSNRLVEELGGGDATWQSNRPAGSRGVKTIAERLTQSPTTKSPSRRGTESPRKTGARTKRLGSSEARKIGSSSPTASSKPTRSTPSRAVSAPSRSSRAGSPPKARPTRRRQPR